MQVASRQCLWKDTIAGSGTILEVEIPDSGGNVRIGSGTLASGSTEITVSWGDGQKGIYSQINGATHTYAKRGTYIIRISDPPADILHDIPQVERIQIIAVTHDLAHC